MSVLPSIAPARRRTFTPYVIGYLVSALLALAYLVFLGVRPDLVAMWRDKPNDAQTAIVETQRNVERALADLDPIKQGVGEMKMEVDNMKTGDPGSDGARPRSAAKVETLERSVAQASEKVASAARGCGSQESWPQQRRQRPPSPPLQPQQSRPRPARRQRASKPEASSRLKPPHRRSRPQSACCSQPGRRSTRCVCPGRSSTIATARP